MASPSSQDSHLHQEYNIKTRKSVGEAESDWLRLGLGLSTNTCRKEEEGEAGSAKLVSESATSHGSPCHLEGYGEQVGLDLRLQIGAGGAGLGSHSKSIKESQWAMHRSSCKEGNHPFHRLGEDKQSWPYHMNSVSNLDHDHCQKMPFPNYQSHHLSTPNSGLWFALRSSANRNGEPALPQIPKAYIRVKDENMPVFMVKKYLVTKLGLSNEAEIEISCMGQKLLQTQSLKEVRDGVWLPRLVEFVNSKTTSFQYPYESPSTTYLMSLHYGRPCLF